MSKSYRTIHKRAVETIVIKKSKFIGQAIPITSEEEALAFLQEIRKEHWDATHNCFAYVVGVNAEVQKASDDGEPSGTAGRPILEVLHKEEIRNALVVVTRYYGGIQLGAGGLVRAYGQATHDALHAAEIITRSTYRRVSLQFDYSWLGTIEHELRALPVFPETPIYEDRVQLYVMVPLEEEDNFHKKMIDLTHGQIDYQSLDTRYASISSKGKLLL